MNSQTLTVRRTHADLRNEFNKAFEDLTDILPLYKADNHIEVINNYLKTYGLLKNSIQAIGRLIYKLNEFNN